ncbi:MAG TPA: COG1361 S-layer family protein [Candidatus Nanoarchaeia archaeon]|nr:COG1361 S-layer family protein [Candidatus Nanoarchaeia archaeon]
MKKIIGWFCVVLLLASAVFAASAKQAAQYGLQINSPYLVVNLLNQEPDPVEPGEIVTLKFQIQNNGTATTDDVLVELLPSYPLSIYDSKNVINIGKLRAGLSGSDALIVEFKLKVDENAVEKEELVDVRVTYGTFVRIYKDFPVDIQTRDVELVVRGIHTEPELVSPGEDFKLKLTLSNNADSLLRNINVKLNLSASVPFVPTQSTAEEYVYQINSNTQRVVTFEVTALPDADGGLYKIPLKITYVDEQGKSFEKEDFIGLKITSKPDLLLTVDQTTINAENRQGTVTLKIVNRGLTDLKLVSAILKSSDDYEMVSSPEIYVGNIDSDDFETVDFAMRLRSYDSNIELPVTLTYRDVTNKMFTQTVSVQFRTGSSGLVLTIIFVLMKFVVTIAVIGGIGYGGYWLYKRRKRRQ